MALGCNLAEEANFVDAGQWKHITGYELHALSLDIVDLVRIGREVALRAACASGIEVLGLITMELRILAAATTFPGATAGDWVTTI